MDGYFLVLLQCPIHKRFRAISLEQGGSGTRLIGAKCCGQWREIQKWSLDNEKIDEIVSELLKAKQ